jgi:hypothetical protein
MGFAGADHPDRTTHDISDSSIIHYFATPFGLGAVVPSLAKGATEIEVAGVSLEQAHAHSRNLESDPLSAGRHAWQETPRRVLLLAARHDSETTLPPSPNR